MRKISIFFLVMLLSIVLAHFLIGDIDSLSFNKECLIIVGIAIVVYFINQQKSDLKSWWIRPSNILLIGLLVVNLQYIVDLVLGFKTYSTFVNPKTANYCCALGSIGTLAYIIGNIYSNSKVSDNLVSVSVKRNTEGCLFLYLLQAVSFISWIMTVDVFALVTGASYADQAWGGGMAGYMEDFFYYSTITILVVKVLDGIDGVHTNIIQFIRSFSFSFVFFVGLYLIIRLLSGDRGPFIYTVLSLLFSYVMISRRNISLKYVLVGGFLFASLMIIVGVARGMNSDIALGEKFSSSLQSLGKARFSDETVFTPTEELALSFRCNETAVNEILSGAPLHYGKYQLYELLNTIPFIPSFLYNNLHIPISELSSDYYLTECYFGDYNLSGQIGTTVIAEFYLELGIIGVILGMFIVGFFFKIIDRIICLSPTNCLSVVAIIIALTFASKAIYIPRSNFLGQLKPTILILIVYYTNKMLSRR